MLPLLNPQQAWAVLGVAILFEVGGTTSLRLSEGLSRPGPTVAIFACYAVAFALNAMVVRTLGLSVTYAVWSGVGTVLTAAIGVWWFKEPAGAAKLAFIGLIVLGVMGLHLSSRGGAGPAPL
jgi:small multidrug resistance pump